MKDVDRLLSGASVESVVSDMRVSEIMRDFKAGSEVVNRVVSLAKKKGYKRAENTWEVRPGVFDTNPAGYGYLIDTKREVIKSYAGKVLADNAGLGGYSEKLEIVWSEMIDDFEGGPTVQLDQDSFVALDLSQAAKSEMKGHLELADYGVVPFKSMPDLSKLLDKYIV